MSSRRIVHPKEAIGSLALPSVAEIISDVEPNGQDMCEMTSTSGHRCCRSERRDTCHVDRLLRCCSRLDRLGGGRMGARVHGTDVTNDTSVDDKISTGTV